MSMSEGRCFSKAAISGALQEVWPPTIAPCFVAGVEIHNVRMRKGQKQRKRKDGGIRGWSEAVYEGREAVEM